MLVPSFIIHHHFFEVHCPGISRGKYPIDYLFYISVVLRIVHIHLHILVTSTQSISNSYTVFIPRQVMRSSDSSSPSVQIHLYPPSSFSHCPPPHMSASSPHSSMSERNHTRHLKIQYNNIKSSQRIFKGNYTASVTH